VYNMWSARRVDTRCGHAGEKVLQQIRTSHLQSSGVTEFQTMKVKYETVVRNT